MSLTLLTDNQTWRAGILQSNAAFVKSVHTIHLIERPELCNENRFRQFGGILTDAPIAGDVRVICGVLGTGSQ